MFMRSESGTGHSSTTVKGVMVTATQKMCHPGRLGSGRDLAVGRPTSSYGETRYVESRILCDALHRFVPRRRCRLMPLAHQARASSSSVPRARQRRKGGARGRTAASRETLSWSDNPDSGRHRFEAKFHRGVLIVVPVTCLSIFPLIHSSAYLASARLFVGENLVAEQRAKEEIFGETSGAEPVRTPVLRTGSDTLPHGDRIHGRARGGL